MIDYPWSKIWNESSLKFKRVRQWKTLSYLIQNKPFYALLVTHEEIVSYKEFQKALK